MGVTAKLAVPKFAAAKKKKKPKQNKTKKTVARPGSGVRPRLIRGEGTVAMVDC